MVATSASEITDSGVPAYDRASELKAFDETKAGVKGLVDAGVEKIPRIFIQLPESLPKDSDTRNSNNFEIPVIDLAFVKDSTGHEETVKKIRLASESFGFFQVINHGIPVSVLDEMLEGVRRFYNQDFEVKKEFYTRDATRKVVYNSNFDLYTAPAANWRDTSFCFMAPSPPKPEELPSVCRDIQIEYSKQVLKLGHSLFRLLSEALGLNPDHLRDMDCDKGLTFIAHCYPACPQPELTIGVTKHTDDGFLTLLLQDHIGGLQILHQHHWIDVPPTPGALVVNIGDLLQVNEDHVARNESTESSMEIMNINSILMKMNIDDTEKISGSTSGNKRLLVKVPKNDEKEQMDSGATHKKRARKIKSLKSLINAKE